MSDAQSILDAAIADFDPAIAAQANEAIASLRAELPNAHVLVYDNYAALAVGFSSTDKATGIAFSITLYPRWVSLFFGRGVELDDPKNLLKGTGSRIRHVVLSDDLTIQHPDVRKLMDEALAILEPPMPPDRQGEVIIKTQVEKKRARRPARK